MLVKPNKTVLEGIVRKVERCDDGWGAEVEFEVARSLARSKAVDFVGAKKGQILHLFASLPEELEIGGRFRLATSFAGGPTGSRIVVQSAKRLAS